MILKINKSRFNTTIGCIYCLWKENSSTEIGNNKPEIIFLGNSEINFNKYIEELKKKYLKNQIIFINKKLSDIENKVKAYLLGREKLMDLKPYFLTGTEFEKKVWRATQSIPCGKVASYKNLAFLAGKPHAWRAVGSALRKNPVMLIIPCHRIIKSDGTVGNFSGGREIKKYLLQLEKFFI